MTEKYTTLSEFEAELKLRPDYDESYLKENLRFNVGQMVSQARIFKGLTQKALADLAETKQPSIARIESGSFLPSLLFLERIAKAMNTYLIAPKFGFVAEIENIQTKSLTQNIVPNKTNWFAQFNNVPAMNINSNNSRVSSMVVTV